MRLKFTTLAIRDFKSFEGDHVLALDVPAGLHFIRGKNRDEPRLASNGSGKTTLWDAFVWCLYGQTPMGLKNPDVVPWSGGKATRVVVRFTIDGVAHRVTRCANPNSLRVDGKNVGPEAVVELLRMSFPLLTSTIVLGQGADLFFDMKPAEKMSLLSDVLGLERWDARSKAASDKVRALEFEHGVLLAEVEQLKRAVKDIDDSAAELKPKENEWQTTFEARRCEVQNFSKGLAARMQSLRNEVAALDLKYDGAMAEVKSCERSVARLGDGVASAQLKLARAIDKQRALDNRVSELTKAIQKLVDVKRCPMCNSVVTVQDLAGHRARLAHERSTAERAAANINLRPLRAALEFAQSSRANDTKYLEAFHSKADSALREHQQKKAELIGLEERERQVKRSFNEQEENPYTAQLRSLRKRRGKRVADLDAAMGDVRSCAKELEQTKFWPRGFRDIKLHIIEELLQELELVTLGALEEVGLVGWDVKYVIERETKSGKTHRGLAIMIGSPRSKGKLVRWESWSGGEGQRLRVVGALALSSVLLNHAGVRPNLEVLDEPAKYISEGGVSDLCAFLAERAKANNLRIFYCDHLGVDAGGNASTITVKRGRSGSWIEQAA